MAYSLDPLGQRDISRFLYIYMSYGPGKVAIGYGFDVFLLTLGIIFAAAPRYSWYYLTAVVNSEWRSPKIIETGVLCYVGSASRCSLPGA
jgi:hypothetical protein